MVAHELTRLTLACTDGVKPYGLWFTEAAKYCTLRTFTRQDVPDVINGVKVTHIAHVSDFYRMDVSTSRLYGDSNLLH